MSAEKMENVEMVKIVNKALNPREKPLDVQLARILIMHTHRLHEARTVQEQARTVWQVVDGDVVLTLNRFTAWKFCNLLHRLLRDGHKQVINDAQSNRHKLQAIIDYWAMHQDHMGQCIALYSKMLMRKLQFHQIYAFFKGDLQFAKLQRGCPQWDTNTRFQLCMDIFDLLEDLLQLQYAIFYNVQREKVAAESTKGKCRLMPLVTVAEECDNLYHHSVAVLQMLYAELPADDLTGLRERFHMIFGQLRVFYENFNMLQFMREFLLIRPLTEPNFYSLIYPSELSIPSAPMEWEIDFP